MPFYVVLDRDKNPANFFCVHTSYVQKCSVGMNSADGACGEILKMRSCSGKYLINYD